MPRRRRRDRPGQFHHIYNQAARKGILFADRADFRLFKSLLARAARRGDLIVHAYCLMGTHFHLLAGSPNGQLSEALMRIQQTYARRRNQRTEHAGALVRGRFGSRPVTSQLYWFTLLRYIAHNPVQAGLCDHPFEYPYSSARHFLERKAPLWFSREGVDRKLTTVSNTFEGLADSFARVIKAPLLTREIELIKQRMADPRVVEDDLDRLYRCPPAYLARWMREKIAEAGDRSPWLPLAAPSAIVEAVEQARGDLDEWCVRLGRNHHDAWLLMAAGLLATLGALNATSAALFLECHATTALRRAKRHLALMAGDERYAERAGHVARRALDLTFGG
ncbi:MAG: transposase [Planctomycetota bacterium]|nr:transposase [Planctomycetota bacterium]